MKQMGGIGEFDLWMAGITKMTLSDVCNTLQRTASIVSSS